MHHADQLRRVDRAARHAHFARVGVKALRKLGRHRHKLGRAPPGLGQHLDRLEAHRLTVRIQASEPPGQLPRWRPCVLDVCQEAVERVLQRVAVGPLQVRVLAQAPQGEPSDAKRGKQRVDIVAHERGGARLLGRQVRRRLEVRERERRGLQLWDERRGAFARKRAVVEPVVLQRLERRGEQRLGVLQLLVIPRMLQEHAR